MVFMIINELTRFFRLLNLDSHYRKVKKHFISTIIEMIGKYDKTYLI
ncbi:hypothetical protein HMPREF1548_06220 [Clostridium sp. KLE 1755]|nr:hypothetical protein HMPREF1548_06220 [Clostridium sp. KLE 1755]